MERGGARAPSSRDLAGLGRGEANRRGGGGDAYRSRQASGLDDGSESGRRRIAEQGKEKKGPQQQQPWASWTSSRSSW